MKNFEETAAAAEFIATADSRETDKKIMEACVFFASNVDEAEANWRGDFGGRCDLLCIWEHVTSNGNLDAADFCWGASGSKWWPVDSYEA